MGRKRLELTGQKFGRLTVIGFSHMDKSKKSMWKCRCECGKETVVYGRSLKVGHTVSCGCYSLEVHTTHGQAKRSKKTKAYIAWSDMHSRCNNPEHKSYEDYGGRGVRICDRWFDFSNFIADMGDPLPHQSIDRIDVNGDYSPKNCRWADRETQCNNKRNTKWIEYKGLKMSLTQWGRWFNISKMTLWKRIYKYGWDEIRALTTPIRKRRKANERII